MEKYYENLSLSRVFHSQMWWLMSMIPATWEAEVGGLWFKGSPGKGTRPYLKNKLVQKRGGEEFKW
jgi:hypothetical protein